MGNIRTAIASIGQAIGTAVALGWLVVGLKSCEVTLWQPPAKPTTYALHSRDGRALAMIFMPNRGTMVWYFDPARSLAEGELTRMRGSYGTHYFWDVWQIDGPAAVFPFRLYPRGTKPVEMEITVLKRFSNAGHVEHFPATGDVSNQILLFKESAVQFQGMWLSKEPSDPAVVSGLLAKFDAAPQ